ncbi:MAG TPA: F0F1 ATP synthase subunit B [Sphingobacterium sp.]|nr:F0F1 ATP synthase subunit B [Sphingobacterium sp.]
MDLLIPEIGLVFWQTLSFLILLFLLTKFAWKPVMKAIKDRETNIESALAAAEKAKLEMTRLTNENELLIKEARQERDELLKEAKILKGKIIQEAQQEAKAEGEKLIAQAKKEIEDQKHKALSEVKSQVSALSLDIARKVLQGEFEDNKKQEDFVSNLLKDVKLN